MPRLIGIIQIALSLVMVMALAVGCAVPSSTPTPASEYPADISGHVTTVGRLKLIDSLGVGHPGEAPPENEVFWLVNISVKNKAYEVAITDDYQDWAIVAGGEVYKEVANILKVTQDRSSLMSVPSGQTGQLVICFSVPRTLQVGDAQICYRGQEPYSYGKLTGGDKVVAYDWGSKTVITEEKPEEHETTQEQAQKEIDIVSIKLLGPQMMEPWVQVVVKYNNYTVPMDVYSIKLMAEFSDGYKLGTIGVKEVSWRDIPGEDPMNFGKVLEFRNARFSNAIQTEKLKPISERRSIKYTISVNKTTPVTSPRYVAKPDEVIVGWENTGRIIYGQYLWVRLLNVSKSGIYTVTFVGTFIDGGSYTSSSSKHIPLGGSGEFQVEGQHKGKKVVDCQYSITYKKQ